MNIRLMEISEPKFPYRFKSSKDAFDAVKDYGKADREVFLVLFLNSQNQLIDCEPVFVGSVGTAAVYPGEVVKSALLRSATGIICAHNHPSGDCTPSGADIEITAGIMLACESVQIRMLDHIIIGRQSYVSMADNGTITDLEIKVVSAIKSMGSSL